MEKMPLRLALLIGINNYQHLGPEDSLRGAVRDVEEMASLLEDRFDFPASGILLLRDSEATRRAVLNALSCIVEQATPESVVVIQWSGHGSEVKTRISEHDVSESPTGKDQTLVPFDARGEGIHDISDKELLGPLSQLKDKGVFVTWIADSCHSGHLYRDSRFGRARRVGPSVRNAKSPSFPFTHSLDPRPGIRNWMLERNRQVLLAACHADQEAFERPLQGQECQGEWTFALVRILREMQADSTARQIFQRAASRMLEAGVPQSPQLIGARDRLIFGVEARPPVPFVEIQGVDENLVELAAGHAQGMIEGSLWDAYPSDTDSPDSAVPSARLQVTRVGVLSSKARVSVARDLTKRCQPRVISVRDRAFEAVPAYGDLRLGVQIVGMAMPAVHRLLEQRIADSPLLRRVDTETAESVAVEFGEEHCQVFDSRGFPIFEIDPELSNPEAASRIVERLERRARWQHGLGLRNRDPRSRVSTSIEARLLRQADLAARGESPASGPFLLPVMR